MGLWPSFPQCVLTARPPLFRMAAALLELGGAIDAAHSASTFAGSLAPPLPGAPAPVAPEPALPPLPLPPMAAHLEVPPPPVALHQPSPQSVPDILAPFTHALAWSPPSVGRGADLSTLFEVASASGADLSALFEDASDDGDDGAAPSDPAPPPPDAVAPSPSLAYPIVPWVPPRALAPDAFVVPPANAVHAPEAGHVTAPPSR